LVLAKFVAETLVLLAGEILGNGIMTSTLGVLADGEPLESASSISGGVATGDISMMCSAYKLDEQWTKKIAYFRSERQSWILHYFLIDNRPQHSAIAISHQHVPGSFLYVLLRYIRS